MLDTIERTPTQTKSASAERVSIYQPEQAGLQFPSIPEFASHAQERQHLKERLVAACRAFAGHGFDYGFAGHLTVRDPEFPQLYWTGKSSLQVSWPQSRLSRRQKRSRY